MLDFHLDSNVGILICLFIIFIYSLLTYLWRNPFVSRTQLKNHNFHVISLVDESEQGFNHCQNGLNRHTKGPAKISAREVMNSESNSPPSMKHAESQDQLGILKSQSEVENRQKVSSTSTTSTTSGSRTFSELETLLREYPMDGVKQMSEEELLLLLKYGKLRAHQLEKDLGDELKAVHIRRKWLNNLAFQDQRLSNIPYFNYDYSFVSDSCCENVIGYVPLPLGYVGPLTVNKKQVFVPMATTEGCLIASTNRGCRALEYGGGVRASVKDLGMSRGPVVMFDRAEEALEMKLWIEKENNMRLIKPRFDMTSRFAKLKEIKCNVAGRLLFMRFVATTGDAMGMNMVSKATGHVLKILRDQYFPAMQVISLSGNFCVDKKPAALNWIEGRGKLVVCDAIVPKNKVREILKSDGDSLVQLNISKNLVGSAVAGSLGGFNAHCANVVAAIFLATGQDMAQTVTSGSCITQLEKRGEDLYISCTMPSLEVGTVGGGTILPAQRACLEMMGVSGGNTEQPGENAKQLAKIIGATVLAGELSLLAALTSGDLVRSHIKHNRSCINLRKISEVGSSTVEERSTSLGDISKKLGDLAGSVLKEGMIQPDSCSQVLT